MVAKGSKLSEETKRKISESVKKKFKESPEIIENGVKKWKKFFNTKEGKIIWEEKNKKVSNTMKGIKKKPFTKKHKENISKATKRQYKEMFPWGKRKSSKIHLKLQKQLYKYTDNFISEEFIRLKELEKWICVDELDRKNKIAIFIDGEHWHARNYKDNYIVRPLNKTAKEIRNKDKIETKCLISKGYQVLRFWDTEIESNLEQCINKILEVTK